MTKKFLVGVDAPSASLSTLNISGSANLGASIAAGSIAYSASVPVSGVIGQIPFDKVRDPDLLKTVPAITSLYNPAPVLANSHLNTATSRLWVATAKMTYDSSTKIQTVAFGNSRKFSSTVNVNDYFLFIGSGSFSNRAIFGQILSASSSTLTSGSLTFYNGDGMTSSATNTITGAIITAPSSAWTNSSINSNYGSIAINLQSWTGSAAPVAQNVSWVIRHNFNTLVFGQLITAGGSPLANNSFICRSLENYDTATGTNYRDYALLQWTATNATNQKEFQLSASNQYKAMVMG